jgi:pheromone a factor receptor
MSIYYLQDVIKHLQPWISWNDVHDNFGVIYYYDATYIGRVSNELFISAWLEKWIVVIAAISFFAFFGLTEDAIDDYIRCYRTVLGWLKLPFRKTNPTDNV